MAVTSNYVWLIGTQTGEVWVGTGDPESRFNPYQPVFIETGVIAADTMIRVSGDTMMWVAQDKDGAGYVVRTEGYNPVKVSTAAVDSPSGTGHINATARPSVISRKGTPLRRLPGAGDLGL
jgi:hypothetical protein